MPHTVRVGDKFRLLDKEFKVTLVKDSWFLSEVNAAEIYQLYWHLGEADKLDWIKPIPKCSKEFSELLLARINNHDVYKKSKADFMDWLDAHTED